MVCQSTDFRGCFDSGIDKDLIIRQNNTKMYYGSMKNKHKLRLGNVNVTTIKHDDKLTQVVLAAKNLGQEMCVVSETHRPSNGIEVVEQGDRVLWSPAVFASMIGEKLEGAPITSLDLTHVSQASDVTNAFLEMIN